MNIIVTGGRHSTDRKAVWDFLDQLQQFHMLSLTYDGTSFTVVQGGATGIDKFAREWCQRHGVNFKNYPYPRNMGKSGGPIRNREMAVKEKPAFVVAFAGGKGTRSMMKIAHELGIPVILAGQLPPEEPQWQPRYLQNEGTTK